MAQDWRSLLSDKVELVLPWTGGKTVSCRDRSWRIEGRLPREYGWFRFSTDGGRGATLLGPADPDAGFEEGHSAIKGFLVGNRLIPDTARVTPDPEHLLDQTLEVFIVERGLERFARAVVVRVTNGNCVYIRQEFPQGPEQAVIEAYQDRKASVDDIPGVTPGLDLAFRFISRERTLAEERAKEIERLRIEEEKKLAHEERLREALKSAGTGAGRRHLAIQDFDAAARAALLISGAELIETLDAYDKDQKIVRYRFMNQRLECVVDKRTLRVTDSGICLTDHDTREKGDTYFTLESLPVVVAEAIRGRKLVVYRHGDGGNNRWEPDDHDREDWDD